MAKVQTAQPLRLNLEQMRNAVTKIKRRIADLESFDIDTIEERFDQKLTVLANKVNSTLEEVLGLNTSEFYRYSVGSFDNAGLIMGGYEEPLSDVKANNLQGIRDTVLSLQSLLEIFEERIADEPTAATAASIKSTSISTVVTKRVFLVHGHDNGSKETVARFLTKLDLIPIILHEQANAGKTVIEKFEAHSNVDFAVILFTPDDVGYPANKPDEAKARARQNVVLELGFFMAALGRNRVCVLINGDIEIPSDYSGVLYLPIDTSGAWRFLLAKEMKAVGMEIDLNKIA